MNEQKKSMNDDWYDEIHKILIDMAFALNSPRRDTLLLARAKVKIDRALFPLLSIIGLRGRVGVVEIAEIIGRDYTTISRQVKKLESLGLIKITRSKNDKRISVSSPTAKGKRMLEKLEKARHSYIDEVFENWKKSEREEGIRILRRFTDAWVKIEP